jgi:phosphoglycerate dehydrogenase-like enzyme
VVHTAGSVKGFVTEACWDRGLRISSAAWANAIPVAEYTLAAILLANKQVLRFREHYRAVRGHRPDWHALYPAAGNYRRRIGIVGASLVGRRVVELMRPHDFDVGVCDPFLTAAEARRLGVTLAEMDELCATAELVSGRIQAVIDVTDPEILPAESPLYDLPNVLLTPHMAGSVGNEMGRLFDAALAELQRYAAGLEFAHPVLRSQLSHTA